MGRNERSIIKNIQEEALFVLKEAATTKEQSLITQIALNKPIDIQIEALNDLITARLELAREYERLEKIEEALEVYRACDKDCLKYSSIIEKGFGALPPNLEAVLYDGSHFEKTFLQTYSARIEYLWNDGLYELALSCYEHLADSDKSLTNPAKTKLIERLKEFADLTAEKIITEASFLKDEKEQKKYLLEQIKKTSPYIKLYLLQQALDKNTSLGKIFWKPRLGTAPSLESGTLKQVNAAVETILADKQSPDFVKGQLMSAQNYFSSALMDPIIFSHTSMNRLRAQMLGGMFNSSVPAYGEPTLSETDVYVKAIENLNRAILLKSNISLSVLGKNHPYNFTCSQEYDHTAYYYLANYHFKLERYENAKQYAIRAIAIDPMNKNCYEILLASYIRLNKLHEAADLSLMMDIGFSEGLTIVKDRKKFIFDRISSYTESKQIYLLERACKQDNVLGFQLLKDDKDGKMLKAIHAKIKQPQPNFVVPEERKQKVESIKKETKTPAISNTVSNSNDELVNNNAESIKKPSKQKGLLGLFSKGSKQVASNSDVTEVDASKEKDVTIFPSTNRVTDLFYRGAVALNSKTPANITANMDDAPGKGKRLSYHSSDEGL